MKRKSILNKIVVIFFYFYLQSQCVQYMPYDQVESNRVTFWVYDPKKQIKPGETLSKVINFTTKFTKTPQVFLSIVRIDIVVESMNFQMLIDSVNQSQVTIKLNNIASHFDGLEIWYMAFVDDNVAINSFNFLYNKDKKQVIQFIKPPKDNKERKVICFPIGYSYEQSKNKSFQFQINTNSITQTTYTMEMSTSEAKTTTSFLINCIEYFQEQAGAYVRIADVQPFNFVNTNSATQTVIINSNFGSYQPIDMIGLVGFQIEKSDANIRLHTQKVQSVVTGQTWFTNKLLSLQLAYFQYQMINCKVTNQTNQINSSNNYSCISDCPDRQVTTNSQSTNICQPCQSSQQYILNNNCLDSKPDNTYCDNNRICKTCKLPCKDCDSSLLSCLSCMPFHYLKRN